MVDDGKIAGHDVSWKNISSSARENFTWTCVLYCWCFSQYTHHTNFDVFMHITTQPPFMQASHTPSWQDSDAPHIGYPSPSQNSSLGNRFPFSDAPHKHLISWLQHLTYTSHLYSYQGEKMLSPYKESKCVDIMALTPYSALGENFITTAKEKWNLSNFSANWINA